MNNEHACFQYFSLHFWVIMEVMGSNGFTIKDVKNELLQKVFGQCLGPQTLLEHILLP